MSLPSTYKAAVFEQVNGELIIKDLPLKKPHQGQLLIKVEACGVCHSDSLLPAGLMGELPRIPGHEIVGHVVEIGPNEKKWKVGDRVGGAWHGGHDGVCKKCQRGLFQMCDNEAINGITMDGGYAEYCLLHSEAAVRLPTSGSAAELAPFLCAGVTVFNGIRHMGTMQGGTVAVQGMGGLGHLAIQYASKMGYRTVALSRGEDKRQFAKELGAHDYIDTEKQDAVEELQKMGGADLIVATAPNPTVISPLVAACGVLGKLLILAPVGPVAVDTISMVTKGISVHGWPSGQQVDSEEAIAFAHRTGVKCLIEEFPLAKAQDAYDHMMSNKARFRAVLTMP